MPEVRADGYKIVDVIAWLMERSLSPMVASVPKEKNEAEETETYAHFYGFCPICEHTHAFCTCPDYYEEASDDET